MKQVIRLSTKYFCHCLWWLFDDGGVEYFPAERLSISLALRNEVENWEAWYSSSYCDECPANSAFSHPQEEAAFWRVGILLQHKLQKELGDGL
ncbi:hypothetical protein JD974_12885 [Chromobacterium haemolyticum]|uniref:Uncharacterized protein n=1 Tax=Chromobacterium haemolyticum TaxID=394935 RepID=A0ABS3GPF5_9NEIS|nr:hypothetical protein [Chromobacterium haemolyticum]MBK0415302.1 hypothetical protein [Chromobacterium haemolyticum]MBO0416482.1 hypothetical protein [Chromobacterium haemolyticum]MBO0499942.1 hypothetical protein [Chromobacterium haemolyticum]